MKPKKLFDERGRTYGSNGENRRAQKFHYEHVSSLSDAVSCIEQEMQHHFVWEENEVLAHKAAKKL